MVANTPERLKPQDSLVINVNKARIKFCIDDVIYIESRRDYLVFNLNNEQSYRTKMTISAMADLLPQSFVRLHRSFIVNSTCIQSHTSTKVLLGDFTLPIGRKFKRSALAIIA